MRTTVRTALAASLALAAAGFASGGAEARDFTIASWGGAYQDGQRDIFFSPFAQSKGIKVLEDVYLGGWAQFKAMQETGNIPWDVVQVESAEVARGCEEGLFLKLDYAKLGGRDRFVDGANEDCGVGVVIVSEVPAYNDKLVGDKKPSKFEDFFDLKNFPGARGMRDDVKYNVVRALLADGVPAGKIYDVLKAPGGLDRAFKKLDTIKPVVTFWTAGAQAPERIKSGDTPISIAYNGRITNAVRDGATELKIVWDQNIAFLDKWVILAKSEHVDLAYEYPKYYSDVNRQIRYAKEKLPYGPAIKGAAEAMSKEDAMTLPVGDNMKTAFITGTKADLDYWLDHLDEVTERWNAWKVKN